MILGMRCEKRTANSVLVRSTNYQTDGTKLFAAVSRLSRLSFVSLAFFSHAAEYLAATHPPELSRFVFTLRPAQYIRSRCSIGTRHCQKQNVKKEGAPSRFFSFQWILPEVKDVSRFTRCVIYRILRLARMHARTHISTNRWQHASRTTATRCKNTTD